MLLVIFFSCDNKDNFQSTFFSKSESFLVKEGAFYSTNNGGLYYHIQDEKLLNRIDSQEKIDSIIFEIKGRKYKAKPLNLTFSRERHNSDFVFAVYNKTQKIVLDKYNGKAMFLLITEKTNIKNLIKLKELKPIEIEDESNPRCPKSR